MDWAYARGLIAAVPAAELARAVVRRIFVLQIPARPTDDERQRAVFALAHAPKLFHGECNSSHARARAEKILARRLEIFGRTVRFDLDWQRQGDPKVIWEIARAGHLVELAAAARQCPDLGPQARGEVRAQIQSFLDGNSIGYGIHYASPLEVSVRVIHWLAALELLGGAAAFPPRFVERLAASLLAEGEFLSRNLEDRYVVCGNHLIGNLVGLGLLGVALDVRAWKKTARRRLAVEIARQVGDDGAHFEASTGYHRFTLDLLEVARRLGLVEEAPLERMREFSRAVAAPDGSDPGFGDCDDARVLSVLSRESSSAAVRAASFPSGGVHVARSGRWYLAMRAGSYGQRGVGGHAHNDQLSIVAHLDGRALIIDPGTGSYTADPVARDRFRGTAAHATVVIDGTEQSPIPARPFALPDRARGRLILVEDRGERAILEAEHRGYRRVRHRRRVTLDRERELILVEDFLEGHGTHAVELRFPVEGRAQLGASASTRARAGALPLDLDLDRAVEIAGRAALIPVGKNPLVPSIERGWRAPNFGKILVSPLVTFTARLSVPLTTAILLMPLGV